MGAFGEMSSDVHAIANVVAEELALEHCIFYADKTQKIIKGRLSPLVPTAIGRVLD